MRKLFVMLILAVVGFTAVAKNSFKFQRGYEGTVTEKEVDDVLVYHIGNIRISAQFDTKNFTVDYFVNGVYIADGYEYNIDGYIFYTSNNCFYFGKDGDTIGDNFYIEPISDNPFLPGYKSDDVDVNPFEN